MTREAFVSMLDDPNKSVSEQFGLEQEEQATVDSIMKGCENAAPHVRAFVESCVRLAFQSGIVATKFLDYE